jgi:type I restriction enzyme S subunit
MDWAPASEAGSRKYEFHEGDILFGKIRPYFHKVVVAPVSGICSTDAIVIRSRDVALFGTVLAVVNSDAFVQMATQSSQGTKMPRANWDVLVKYPVAIPPPALLSHFNGHMNETATLIQRLVMTNRTLRATRDLLLPRLISGEVDVSDLDIAIPEVAA